MDHDKPAGFYPFGKICRPRPGLTAANFTTQSPPDYMRLLITGICGFVGSTLARALMEERPGLALTGIDNLARDGAHRNLDPLRALGVDIRHGDLRVPADLDALPPADGVIDCAAQPSVLAGTAGSGCTPAQLVGHNLEGTLHLLEYCRHHKAAFILLSTSRVYSIPPLAALPVVVLHALDVARFMAAFIAAPRAGEVYNLGGGKANSTSILAAFRLAEKHSGRPMRYTYVDEPRVGDHVCYYSDLRKMRAHYPGWDITQSLDETVRQLVESWRSRPPSAC